MRSPSSTLCVPRAPQTPDRVSRLIPEGSIAADPSRVVWIARVSGDLLNLHDYPWSRSGAPDQQGDIVIDDATGEILGVYPNQPLG